MGQHDVLRVGLGLLGYPLILFENLFKPRQLRLAVGMVTDFVSLIYNLKTVF